jgi:hypothetical protein
LSVDASNTQTYERRKRERRDPSLSLEGQIVAAPDTKRRKKRLDKEVWWVIATFVMMGVAFVTLLLVQ